MSAGWVAGSVRARALARRRVGAAEARGLASCGSLAEAMAVLAATPYRVGARNAGQDLAAAQHAIAAALLWDMRVLAGWLPQSGALRALAGWFEIANVAERLAELDGRTPGELFSLGALATAWPQLRRSGSLAELRRTLAASAWRDPGGSTAAEIEVGMRARWASRVATLGESTRILAGAALALLVAGERFGVPPTGSQRPENPVLTSVAASLLGQATYADSLDELAGRLPRRLAWVFDPVMSPGDLWRAEAAWWGRAEREGHRLLAGSGFESGPVIGAVIVLAADARRVGAALEIAARGGGPIEAFDAVA
jgi:hypothetical protein